MNENMCWCIYLSNMYLCIWLMVKNGLVASILYENATILALRVTNSSSVYKAGRLLTK